MKSSIILTFCILFAGSTLLQSCKKPDTAQNGVPPVDAVAKPTTAEIIQKALQKLATDTFVLQDGFARIAMNKWVIAGEYPFSYSDEVKGPWVRSPFLGLEPIGDSGMLAIGRTYVKGLNNAFYDKIFVNAAQDSFIGLICKSPKNTYKNRERCEDIHSISSHSDVSTISATDFSDMRKYKTMPWEGQGSQKPTNVPDVEVQYYYNKDSLSVFEFYEEEEGVGPYTRLRHTYIRAYYVNKKK